MKLIECQLNLYWFYFVSTMKGNAFKVRSDINMIREAMKGWHVEAEWHRYKVTRARKPG